MNHDLFHWNSETGSIGYDNLNDTKFEHFVERTGFTWDTQANALKKLGLIKEARLLNAAALFFAKIVPIQLHCAVFATIDTPTLKKNGRKWLF